MDKDKSYLWKFLAAVAGVYGLFIFETTTHLYARKRPGEKQTIEVRPKNSRKNLNVKLKFSYSAMKYIFIHWINAPLNHFKHLAIKL